MLFASSRWNASGRIFRSASTGSCLATTGCVGEGFGDHVLVEGAASRLVTDRVGQSQHVVLGAGALGNVDDVAEQDDHFATLWSRLRD